MDSDLPMTQTSEDPDLINTAVFYSITSTQRGLTVSSNLKTYVKLKLCFRFKLSFKYFNAGDRTRQLLNQASGS